MSEPTTQVAGVPRASVYVLALGDRAVFLGYGTVIASQLVVVHPTAARAAGSVLGATGVTHLRVRCRFDTPGQPVIDGTLVPADDPRRESFLAVHLDQELVLDPRGPGPDVDPATSTDDHPWVPSSTDEYAEHLAQELRVREESDPPAPPEGEVPSEPHGGVDPPPYVPDAGGPVGSRPFWCMLFSRAAGCT